MSKKLIISFVIVLAVIALFVLVSKPKVSNINTEENTNTYVVDPVDNTNGNDNDTSTSNNPNTSTSTGSVSGNTATAKIGQTITVSGVTGTVKELVEDSRCPSGVQCIWAGRVLVKVGFVYGTLNEDVTLTLGEELSTYGHTITLTSVSPEKVAGVEIASSDYKFNFIIK